MLLAADSGSPRYVTPRTAWRWRTRYLGARPSSFPGRRTTRPTSRGTVSSDPFATFLARRGRQGVDTGTALLAVAGSKNAEQSRDRPIALGEDRAAQFLRWVAWGIVERRAAGIVALAVAVLTIVIMSAVVAPPRGGVATRSIVPVPPAVGSCGDLRGSELVILDCVDPRTVEVTYTWTADVPAAGKPTFPFGADIGVYYTAQGLNWLLCSLESTGDRRLVDSVAGVEKGPLPLE